MGTEALKDNPQDVEKALKLFQKLNSDGSKGQLLRQLISLKSKLKKDMIKLSGSGSGLECKFCDASGYCHLFYRCFQCEDCLICENCFDFKKELENHRNNHAMVIFSKQELLQIKDFKQFLQNGKFSKHFGITCSECKSENILGYRFKCQVCVNYDLCQNCFVAEKHKDHQMILFSKPVINQFSVKDYELLQVVGKGCFAKVWKAKKKEAQGFYAIKEINLGQYKQIDQISLAVSVRNQIRAYNEVRSSYIVKYLGYELDEKKSRFYVLMNWISEGTLEQMILKKPEKASLRRRIEYIKFLLHALLKLHNKNFVHKDIKPDNLFVDRGNILKVGDMGVSGPLQLQERLAPVRWAAPQLLSRKAFGTPVDIFSFGLVLSFIFSEQEHTKLFQTVSLPQKDYYFKQIVKICISKLPQQRPSALQLLYFFEEFDKKFWEKLHQNGTGARQYINLPNQEKNSKFKAVYDQIIKELNYRIFFQQKKIGRNVKFFVKTDKYWGLYKEKVDALSIEIKQQDLSIKGIIFGGIHQIQNQKKQGKITVKISAQKSGVLLQEDFLVKQSKQHEIKLIFKNSIVLQKSKTYIVSTTYQSYCRASHGTIFDFKQSYVIIKKAAIDTNGSDANKSPIMGFIREQSQLQKQKKLELSTKSLFFQKYDKYWRVLLNKSDALNAISQETVLIRGLYFGALKKIFKSKQKKTSFMYYFIKQLNQQQQLQAESAQGQSIQLLVQIFKESRVIYKERHQLPYSQKDYVQIKLKQSVQMTKGIQYDFKFTYLAAGLTVCGLNYDKSLPFDIKKSKHDSNGSDKPSSPFVGLSLLLQQGSKLSSSKVEKQKPKKSKFKQIKFFDRFDQEWFLNKGMSDAIDIINISKKVFKITGFLFGGVIGTNSQSRKLQCRVIVMIDDTSKTEFSIHLSVDKQLQEIQVQFKDKVELKPNEKLTIIINYESRGKTWYGRGKRQQQDLMLVQSMFDENGSSDKKSVILGLLTE